MNSVQNNPSFFPKELATAAVGVTLSSASGIAMQYLSDAETKLPEIVSNFFYYGSGAAAVAGAVMAIYSAVMLCKRIASDEGGLTNALSATFMNIGISALALSLYEHFDEIAPYFWDLEGSSMAYAIATNFAWQACALIGAGALIATAYAAYRVGVSVLAQQPADA